MSSFKPLNIVNPFANEATIDNIGISSTCNGMSTGSSIVEFKFFFAQL